MSPPTQTTLPALPSQMEMCLTKPTKLDLSSKSMLPSPSPSSHMIHSPTISPPAAVTRMVRLQSGGIHSLPVELLSRIFVLGSGLSDLYGESPFLLKPDQEYRPTRSAHFQVTISHVCRHWRQVALRTQALWTTLHFREPVHLERARVFMSRCPSAGSVFGFDILVDTVSVEEHCVGVTLYKEELRRVFELIVPVVKRWRAFHLKVCDNECKAIARHFLSSCGPAPRLKTLQLYHFEDYRTSNNLWLATHRPPVIVFDNTLPSLENVSLIGVNLPWAASPYLRNLRHLELALHPNNIRPPYEWWDRMLRSSPELKKLCLHYSGPKLEQADEPALRWRALALKLEALEELYLIDLDPDYLCDLMKRLVIPNVTKLHINLLDQDFTPFLAFVSQQDEQERWQEHGDSTVDLDRDGNGESGGSSSSVSSTSPLSSSSFPPSTPTSPSSSPSFPFSFPSPSSPTSTSSTPSPPASSSSSWTSSTPDGDITTTLLVTPFLNLAKLERLHIGGLDCSPSAWLTFLSRLQGLKELYIDFGRVPFNFRHPFMGKQLAFTFDHASSAGGSASMEGGSSEYVVDPVLPRLEWMRVSGISGRDLATVIRHRSLLSHSRGATNPRWGARWCERRKGRDPELDELVSAGICVECGGERVNVRVNVFDDDDEGGDGEDGSEGSECGEDEGEE